jgi:hypothetical protein
MDIEITGYSGSWEEEGDFETPDWEPEEDADETIEDEFEDREVDEK